MLDHFPADGTLRPCPLADGLHTACLANGLKVIIREDHRLPVAVCNAWVKVGSNHEPAALRGWSHGIEHLLFKGTARRREGDFAREVAEAGGATNAGTGYETTNYHITVPAGGLPVAVDILGDVLFCSAFAPAALDAERQVLVHENHMYDDIPFGFGVTWRWAMELGFDVSPYRHPIGGRDENLLERDRADILAFWRSAYRPDNMTVVVVGDVDPQAAFVEVRNRFGAAAAPTAAADPALVLVEEPPVEPPHRGCRLRVERGDIQRAYAKLVLPAPGESSGERPLLGILRRVLSDGRSCRLYREIQESQQLVDDFTVMTETGPREGVLAIDLETDPARLAAAVRAVVQVLDDLAADGCSEQELERAKVRVARSFLFGEETVQGQAATLGYHDSVDDLPGAFAFPERVAAVDRAAVTDFCRRRLRRSDLSVVLYLPRDAAADDLPGTAAELETLLAGLLGERPPAAPPTAAAVAAPPRRPARPAPAGTAPAFEVTTLSNGIEVCLRRDPAVPVVAVALTTRGGATGETAAQAGLAALTQAVQIKGTGRLDAAALHEQLEGEGASLSPRTERDFTGLTLTGLSERLDRALSLAGELIADPAFDPREIEQERRLAREELTSLQDNPFQAAALRLRELLYGPDHPYGRPLPGTLESLPGLDRGQLLRRHRTAWTAANTRAVVSGDFDRDRLLERLEEMLGGLPPGGQDLVRPGAARWPAGLEAERLQRDQNQSVVLTAWPGPLDPDEDRVPLLLLKEILNGQAGRLFESLRNRRSLCYNTGTLSTAGFGQGMFVGYVMTAPESETRARDALVEELAAMARQPAGAAEFARARSKLLGSLLISMQSNAARVGTTARDRLYGRAADDLPQLVAAIEGCAPPAVQAVAARLIDPQHRFEVIIGP